MNKFKIITFVILFSFSVQSYAFFPLIAALFGAAETSTVVGVTVGAGEVSAAEFLMATGSRVAMKTAIESSLAVHGGIAAITFGSAAALSSQSSTAPAPLQIVLDPNKPLITPPNWSQAVLGTIQPTPPNTTPLNHKYGPPACFVGFDCNKYYTTLTEACGSVAPSSFFTSSSLSGSNCQLTGVDGYVSNTPTYLMDFESCPTGYSQSGNSCVTVNVSQIMKPSDNVCQLITQGSVITPDTRDPDCKNADLLAQGIDASDPQKLVITNPAKTDQLITRIYSDHVVEIEHLFKDNSGNTVHDKVQFDPKPSNPDASPIIGTSHTINQGTGSLEKTSTLPTAPTFDKSGLATSTAQETQLTETKTTNTKLDKLNTNFDCTGQDCINQIDSSKQQIDSSTAEITAQITEHGNSLQQNEGLFSGLWQPAFEKTECIPLQKNIMNKNIVIDQCPTVSFIQKLLTWLFNLFGLWFVLTRLFVKG